MLDAYALRKAAPRILIAVIGINLSIYLCLAAVDLTNILGRGLGQLISSPFINGNSYDFGIGLDPVTEAAAITGGVGIFIGSGALATVLGAGAFAAAAPVAVISMVFLIILPVLLIALAVMITIVIRQMMLIFLIIVSPVAIACFVLPGTEKYFKQWWDTFLKTLLVYPIIALIFALSDVMGSIAFQSAASGNGASGVVKIITGILVIFAPLVLIPFAFKLAGGIIGRIAAIATSGAGKVAEMGPLKGRREIAKRQMQRGIVQERASMAGRLQDIASRNNANTRAGRFMRGQVGNRLLRGGAGAIGGWNIEAQASALREQASKEAQDQTNHGRDEELRGLTADMTAARADFRAGTETSLDSDGRTVTTSQNGLMRINGDGTTQFKSLGGAWINESHVRAGQSRWGRDTFMQQAALSYEMRKAASNEEVQGINDRYLNLATNTWGMTRDQAVGDFVGAGFENQNQHLEFKHMRLDAQGNMALDHKSFVKEAYEKKGSYPLANMSAHTFDQLQASYDQFEADGDQQGMADVRAVAETFVQRMGAGAGPQIGEADGQPIPATQQPGAATAGAVDPNTGRVYSSGSGHVNEAARRLAQNTGALTQAPEPGREQN